MAEKWTPVEDVKEFVNECEFDIRGKTTKYLYEYVEFWIAENFNRLGITLSKRNVYFNPMIVTYPFSKQAAKIIHELTHVAQYMDYGWFGFMFKYLSEWVKSGLSYEKMKSFGLEKEAYANELKFRLIYG